MTEIRILTEQKMPLLLTEAEILGRLPMELVYKGWRQAQEHPLFVCPICKTVCLHTLDPEIREVAAKSEREVARRRIFKNTKRKEADKMMEGIVKFFNAKRGFGFIAGNDKKDYFVHYTNIAKEEKRRYLEQGQIVRFGIVQGEKGPKAAEVIVLKESA